MLYFSPDFLNILLTSISYVCNIGGDCWRVEQRFKKQKGETNVNQNSGGRFGAAKYFCSRRSLGPYYWDFLAISAAITAENLSKLGPDCWSIKLLLSKTLPSKKYVGVAIS